MVRTAQQRDTRLPVPFQEMRTLVPYGIGLQQCIGPIPRHRHRHRQRSLVGRAGRMGIRVQVVGEHTQPERRPSGQPVVAAVKPWRARVRSSVGADQLVG
jgi:hypothetical protein